MKFIVTSWSLSREPRTHYATGTYRSDGLLQLYSNSTGRTMLLRPHTAADTLKLAVALLGSLTLNLGNEGNEAVETLRRIKEEIDQ